MTQSLGKDSTVQPTGKKSLKLGFPSVDVIQALTPVFIATIGGAICITVLVVQPAQSEGFITVASTAIAGAAGLAQPQKEPGRKNE